NLSLKTIIDDIKDVGLLKQTFSKLRPEIVFHAAAFKHVPLMEKNVAAAFKNNVIGSRNLIYAAEHYNAKRFVLISTDKVVNPTSVMGATKRIVEMVLQAKAKSSRTKFMAVRFGNVLGSNGSVVPLFKKQIEDGGPITVTHPDARRYFMSVHEAVRLILQTGAIGEGGEIFILDMGEQIKIVDLARNLITLSGLKPGEDIAIKFTGLRPGEKLKEETLHDAERDKVTKHNKIYITQSNNFDSRKLRGQIKELEKLIKIRDERKIVKKIQEIVPLFTPGFQYNE
ncbi:MAG: polysaccharide biosynthesis protein, partial [Candidatus Saelkia tenebricola]|nr:polysaccharide biosynthesis protein [Candidatus Saelkia tenebricola]